MYLPRSSRSLLPANRAFSRTTTARARRTIQEIRQSRLEPPPGYKEPTPEQVQKMLIRESERAFGADLNISGDPTAYVNRIADDIWKDVFKASGNDPRVFEAWRDEIKSRSTSSEDPANAAPSSKAGRVKRR